MCRKWPWMGLTPAELTLLTPGLLSPTSRPQVLVSHVCRRDIFGPSTSPLDISKRPVGFKAPISLPRLDDWAPFLFSPPSPGARGEAEAPDSDQEALGGQPEAAGGVADLSCQAQEVHRVGLQHHWHELTLSSSPTFLLFYLLLFWFYFIFFFLLAHSDTNTDEPIGIRSGQRSNEGVNT